MTVSYRQSSYDPLATPLYGAPLKPFNWVQRCGAVMIWLSVAAFLLYAAGQLGLIAFSAPGLLAPIIGLGGLGSVLVNSRRTVIPLEQQADYRRKLRRNTAIALAVALGAAAVGAAAVMVTRGVLG